MRACENSERGERGERKRERKKNDEGRKCRVKKEKKTERERERERKKEKRLEGERTRQEETRKKRGPTGGRKRDFHTGRRKKVSLAGSCESAVACPCYVFTCARAERKGRNGREGERERERERERASGWLRCRKRSSTLTEQKGTKLISEALTNYFLRKGVGYLQLSPRRHDPFRAYPLHPSGLRRPSSSASFHPVRFVIRSTPGRNARNTSASNQPATFNEEKSKRTRSKRCVCLRLLYVHRSLILFPDKCFRIRFGFNSIEGDGNRLFNDE